MLLQIDATQLPWRRGSPFAGARVHCLDGARRPVELAVAPRGDGALASSSGLAGNKASAAMVHSMSALYVGKTGTRISARMKPYTWTTTPCSTPFSSIDMKPGILVELSSLPLEAHQEALRACVRPLDALLQQGPQPPPFLVSEPRLDGVISWAPAGNSFVVWDPSAFARDVLPHSFKHANFASFVRQLNTYGFRKVHADRWEFAHEGFLRGSKHLLKTIVRSRSSPPTQQSSIQPGSSIFRKTQPSSSTLDPELQSLRIEKNALLQEVARLKKEHSQTVEHMSTLNQRLDTAEDRQKQLVSFLAKLLQNPGFLRQLRERREEIDDSARVQRKFLKHSSTESGDSSSLPRTGESGLELPAHPIAHDAIADLQSFLLEDTDLSDGGNFGLDRVPAPEGIGALVTQDELDLGTGAELLEMTPASSGTAHCQDSSTIGRSRGKNVMCPGLDGTSSSEADCLVSLPDNMGMVSGASTAGKLVDADDDGKIWGVDAYLQSSCGATAQQAYGSLASDDPYLMEIANKPDRFWELGFEALDDD